MTENSDIESVKLWADVSFLKLQEELLHSMAQIKQYTEQSLGTRGKLAEETKQLNKKYKKTSSKSSEPLLAMDEPSSPEEVSLAVQEYKSLIKHYQGAVDELTARCNFSDGVVEKMASRFSNLPDLGPILEKVLSNEDSVRFGNGAFSDDSNGISVEDYELVTNELESCQRKIVELETQQPGTNTHDDFKGPSSVDISQTKQKLQSFEQENSILLEKLEHLQKSKEEEQKIVAGLKDQVAELLEANKVKDKTLLERQDYENIKNRLETLQKNQYAILENKKTDATNASSGAGAISKQYSEETTVSILETNKKLQSKLAELRGTVEDMKQDQTRLSAQLQDSTNEISRLTEENRKLEEDLENLDDVSSKFTDTQSIIRGGLPSMTGNTSNNRDPFNRSVVGSIINGGNGDSLDSANGMLQIIKQQRDRFRNKNVELEKQLKMQLSKIESLTKDMDKLKQGIVTQPDRNSHGAKDIESGGFNRYKPASYYDNYDSDKNAFEQVFNVINKYVSTSRTSKTMYVIYGIFIHLVIFILLIIPTERHVAL
ncbi:Protein CASP [Hanseniaspora osmophila]|uniref:Protein CASP n=1 Tax=Hanseniaspora osmophila TaxID=56408 RepID=A0A1E5RIC7_9ASCO|nr:Protein CASP [Hanseniaspora osmophila]